MKFFADQYSVIYNPVNIGFLCAEFQRQAGNVLIKDQGNNSDLHYWASILEFCVSSWKLKFFYFFLAKTSRGNTLLS